ncbi:hypothetical protein BJY04DRAFT_213906 [Aspergillus karnatakaensis]|uniref:uncharacterized protein n=1 Tax=Aspergillus karnatakaensis TaxID=1810916 RepID=UPI003CCC9AF0
MSPSSLRITGPVGCLVGAFVHGGLGSTTFNLQDWTFFSSQFVLSPQSAYNAPGGFTVDSRFSHNPKVLHVPGIIIGTVKKVYNATSLSNSDDSGGQCPDSDWSKSRFTSPEDHNQQQYVSGETWPEAWIRTCEIIDRETNTGAATRRTIYLRQDSFEAVLRRLNLQAREAPEDVAADVGTYLYGSAEPSSWDGIHTVLKPQRLTYAESDTAMEARFYLISLASGHVGFGGYAVREGDIVCILKGGSYPYVLGPRKDGFYHLISDAYIHGVMNGELVRNVLVQGKYWEEFGIV